jgi:hypothetical protein
MVADGIVIVTKAAGNIETKRRFKNYHNGVLVQK